MYNLARYIGKNGFNSLNIPKKGRFLVFRKRSSLYAYSILDTTTLYRKPNLYTSYWKVWRKRTRITISALGLLVLSIVAFPFIHNAFALSAWTQSDWQGGLGTSTINQYSSATDVNTSTNGIVKLNVKANWYGAEWGYRKNITFDNSQTNLGVAPDTLTNFPIMIKLTSANFNFSKTQAAGQDIRFTASDGITLLNYQIESWDSTAQKATLWVKVPTIAAGSTTTGVYMYYGNSTASDAQNTTATWDASYKGVWHLNQPSGSILDSTSNHANGTNFGSTYTASGIIGGAGQFSGSSNYIDAGDNPITGSSPFTLSAWVNPTDTSKYSAALSIGASSGSQLAYIGTVASTQAGAANTLGGGFYGGNYGTGVTNLNQWSLLTMTFTGGTNGTTTFYVNGVAKTTVAFSPNLTIGNVRIGRIGTDTAYDFAGLIDEVRLSAVARSAGSVAADYKSGSNGFDTIGSEEAEYVTTGTLTSSIFDGIVGNNWGTQSSAASVPAGTNVAVKVRSGNQPDLSDAPAFSSCSTIASGSDITSACAPDKTRYAQYQVTFNGDGTTTPTLNNISINYSTSDNVAPTTNASNISLSKSNGGSAIAFDGWTNAYPYATWSSGADNFGGSGIKGYCLYLGQDPSGNPMTTKGNLGNSPIDTSNACQFAVSSNNVDLSTNGYIGTALSSLNTPYFLNVVAIDNANNVYNSGSAAQFEFRYDNSAPINPAFISAPSEFVSNKAVNLTWDTTGGSAPSDLNSGVAGLQYRIGNSGTWYGNNHTGTQDLTDLLGNSGSYTMQSSADFPNLKEGNNLISFRTWDAAGNVSQAYVTTVVKINTSAPSSPQNLTATPPVSATNSFGFSWLAPTTYQGSIDNMKYCYSVNSLPNSNNCIYTPSGALSLPAGAYATEPGDNTIYIVAKDEAGNINYATYASTTFTANTPAPGVPLNLDIADISVKEKNIWKIALSWETPSTIGAGIATYRVSRSTDGLNYTNIASTAGTSYVDSGLSQKTYYYNVKACDSANNCGALTPAINTYPTGKFTTSANMISGPTVTDTTRDATVTWTTDRNSDSQIEYGLSSNHYFATAASNATQTTSHTIALNSLDAGTTYFYRTLWTDADGNIGTSNEGKFTTLPAPSVSNVTVTNVNLNTATINFTVTGASQVKLYYGSNGSFGTTTVLNTSSETSSYSIPLQDLSDGTTYSYRINPSDISGYEYTNATSLDFTTPPAPRITNVQFQPVVGSLTGTETVSWTTNVPTTTQISYSVSGKSLSSGIQAIDTKPTTQHAMTIENLQYNQQYQIMTAGQDSLGNLTRSDIQVFHTGLDTRPPTLSAVTIQPSIRGTGASATGQIIVSWKTDKAGSSQVAYGEGSSGDFSSRTAEDASLGTSHTVVISNLPTSQVFHIQAMSKDEAGNIGLSQSQTTIIGQSSDSALSIVFNSLRAVFGLN